MQQKAENRFHPKIQTTNTQRALASENAQPNPYNEILEHRVEPVEYLK
jgi:hypothetical protein